MSQPRFSAAILFGGRHFQDLDAGDVLLDEAKPQRDGPRAGQSQRSVPDVGAEIVVERTVATDRGQQHSGVRRHLGFLRLRQGTVPIFAAERTSQEK